jgi:uncharacterized membrane protein
VSTLIAIGYPDATTALRAADAVDRLADDVAIQPEAAAAIGRVGDGEFWVTTTHQVVGNGESWGMFWGLLFGLAFFVPLCGMPIGAGLAGLLGNIEKTGLDAEFTDQLRDLLRPDTSALFLVVTKGSQELALAGLSEYDGTVLERHLIAEAELRLQEALHGQGVTV